MRSLPGLALWRGGNAGAASAPLEKFIAGGGDPKHAAIAGSHWARRRISAATDRRRRNCGGASMHRSGGQDQVRCCRKPRRPDREGSAPLCDGALAEAKRTGKQPSVAVVKSCLDVYGRSGAIGQGIRSSGRADLRSYSYREAIGKSKVALVL